MTKIMSKNVDLSRREVFRFGSMATAAGLLGAFPAGAAPAPAATLPMRGGGPDIYTRFGVKPFINCTSTYTINGGSAALPEVVDAIREASVYHVNLDELMEAVGPRIAEMLGAEAAMVSSGAAGAVTCGTLACIAGGDPEKIQLLPETTGLKNEVVVPRWSRSVYDHAVRSVGAVMIEVDTLQDLERAFGPRTAMATGQANMQDGDNKFSLEQFVAAAHKRGVPVLIDAAAELPLVPNPFLSRGVDLVTYSGGKILLGPQTAGILLGRKDLIKAAFTNSAPHHAFARAMKVSKEEVIGVAVAVETLVKKRDREAEDREWRSWYRHISDLISKVPGVTGEIVESPRPSYYPILKVSWDPKKIGLTAGEVGEQLLKGEPRIMTHAGGEGHDFIIRPAALYPGEYKLVADRLHEVFKNAPGEKPKPKLSKPVTDVSGHWDVDIQFVVGSTKHKFYLDAKENELSGSHIGQIAEGRIRGAVSGSEIEIRSSARYEAGPLRYKFSGRIAGDSMSGEVDLGEYGTAKFTAKRA